MQPAARLARAACVARPLTRALAHPQTAGMPAHGSANAQALALRAAARAAWENALEQRLGCEVRLVPTRSRRRPLQLRVLRRARPERGIAELVELRLHALFDEAPPELHDAVANWVRSGARARRACKEIDVWIRDGLERVPAPRVRTERLRVRGAAYDLAALAEEVRREHFASEFESSADLPPITWGRVSARRPRRTLRLGSCDPDGRLVRIHPVLDQPGVPRFFVRFVVHHELLHAVIPPRQAPDGRWTHHGADFRARERAYPEYALARRWEEEHMGRLLRSARRGLPLASAEPRRTRTPANVIERAARFVQRVLFPA